MITKPVSKIFNVKGTANGSSAGASKYDLGSLTKEYIAILDKDGKLAKLTAGSANDTMSSLKEFDIYYKDKTGFVHKQPGYKHLFESDIHNINLKNATDGTPFYAVIKDYKYCCDGEYGFRFMVHNAELDKLFWPNGYYETYMVPIDECCAACGGSSTENDNIITKGLYNAIKANEDSWLTPKIIVTKADKDSDPDYPLNTIISVDDLDNIIEDDSPAETGLLITVKSAEEWPYAQYNFKYTHVRASRFEVGKIASAKCSVNVVSNADPDYSYTASTSADITYIESGTTYVAPFEIAQTDGYDLKQVEYQLMGYRENMSPYRLSDVTMTEFGYNYSFDEDEMYHVLTVNYEKLSDAATVHMPYPMSIVFAFEKDGGSLDTLKNQVAAFFTVDGSADANLNLK